ncbi:MAG: transcriptional regulator with XRE-family HTH domain [Motiliproteus sp.]|jgi:transcriptional regulator with XRE-family HTH domain
MNNPLPVRLRSARKAANLTQQQLGVLLGMDLNTASARMNQYEKGKHSPDFQTLQRLAEKLGVPVAYFFCEEEVTAEIVKLVSKLSPQEKKHLLDNLQPK